MRVLAVETATMTGGVALLDGDRVVGECTLSVALTHSERLIAMTDRLVQDCGWTAGHLEAIAVSVGPGSFTGLRVGLATVKGLALALDIPVAAVPTLDALAAGLPFADTPVAPILDARKGEVYTCLYRWREGEAAREWPYVALGPDEAVRRFPPGTILLGDGVEVCRPHVEARGAGLRIAPAARRLPSAAVVGQLGLARLRAGERVKSLDALVPVYLRPSEAELKRVGG